MTEHDLVFHRQARNLPSIKNIPPNRCDWPWKEIHIDKKGRIFLCGCDAWVPFSVGHILDFTSMSDIFQTTTAQLIQNGITSGTYEYCDTTHCGVANEVKTLAYDYEIQLGIDDSCNLQCPSCRKEFLFDDSADYVNERQIWLDRVKDWIHQSPNSRINILVGSNGEPFASPVYQHFLKTEFNPNVHYEIRSNGTLIKRHIDNLAILPNLKIIKLSIDAASAYTYERVRKPAKWNALLDNIDYLNSLKSQYKFKVYASFVIQQDNLEDVLPFIEFCEDNEIDSCDFTLLQDWGSFDNFNAQCVHRADHALHNRFKEIISTAEFKKLNPSWLTSY